MDGSDQDDVIVRDWLGQPPFRIDLRADDSMRVATCLIAESMFRDFFVTADTVLVREAHGWELYFLIVRHAADRRSPPVPMVSSNLARPYVPEGRRDDVRQLAADSLEALLRGYGCPPRIHRTLAEPGKRSLRLHDALTAVLDRWGYRRETLSAETEGFHWIHVHQSRSRNQALPDPSDSE